MKHSSNEIYRISKWSHFFYKGEVMAALHALSLETLFVKNCGVLNRQVSVSLTLGQFMTQTMTLSAMDCLITGKDAHQCS